METETTRQSLDRLSLDTSANINEDVTWASEISSGSRHKKTESIFSSLRTSIDGNSGYVNNFNILTQGDGPEDKPSARIFTILGPNSIFDLTQALDSARVKLNKVLRPQVSVNGGAQTYYNLNKPSTKEIPPIQLQTLKHKVSSDAFKRLLVDEVTEVYKDFELSYNPLTVDVLSNLAQLYNAIGKETLQTERSEDDIESCPIPPEFKDSHFRLDDPRVFRQVMQHSSISQNQEGSEETQLINNPEVQEKLLRYLDLVEIQLISEISKTSNSFFTTLGDIKAIKSESKACVERLAIVDQKLASMENSQAKTGLEILNLLDESRSVDRLEKSVLQLKSILQHIEEAQYLYENGKNFECLRSINTVENLIGGVKDEESSAFERLSRKSESSDFLVNMSYLTSLRTGKKDLGELKRACSQGYITQFVHFLVDDLRFHYQSVHVSDAINRMDAANHRTKPYDTPILEKSYSDIAQETLESLRDYIKSLTRFGFLLEAFAQYQESILTEAKSIIRCGLPMEHQSQSKVRQRAMMRTSPDITKPDVSLIQDQPSSDSDHNKGTLSSNIKSLSNGEFTDMMRTLYARLSECLRRLTVHQKLLLDLSLTSLSPTELKKVDVMSLDITSAINKAIEITQARIVKVLNVRLEQLGDLSIEDYLYIHLLSSAYLLECESINPGFNTSELGRSLNEWIKNHVGYFLHRFHSNSLKSLASNCDNEIWREYVGDELISTQKKLDQIISYSEFVRTGQGFDGSDWARVLLNLSQRVGAEKEYELSSSHNPSPLNPPDKISLRGESFFIPLLIVSVVKITSDYVILSKIFGAWIFNIMQNLLTYLKVLNSRMSLAILNAGATRTAGLKHITTKHLALCIQTVDFLGSYSGLMQEIFTPVFHDREHEKDNEPTFEIALSHFKEHKTELVNKLVTIMHDRTLSHCTTIKGLDLSQAVTYPQQCRPYMETIVKETLTVSRVIGKYLPSSDSFTIMLRIFDNYKKLLVNCYCIELPKLKDFNEKHSLLKDIDYFRVKLGDLEGYGNSGQVIWENVNSLPTIEDTTMEEKMKHNIASESSRTDTHKDITEDTSNIGQPLLVKAESHAGETESSSDDVDSSHKSSKSSEHLDKKTETEQKNDNLEN